MTRSPREVRVVRRGGTRGDAQPVLFRKAGRERKHFAEHQNGSYAEAQKAPRGKEKLSEPYLKKGRQLPESKTNTNKKLKKNMGGV